MMRQDVAIRILYGNGADVLAVARAPFSRRRNSAGEDFTAETEHQIWKVVDSRTKASAELQAEERD